MQLNQLQRKTENKTEKRVGRGGIRGKTSGRGTKGQNARAGHKKRPDVREKIKKLPKLRGRGIAGLKSIQEKPMVVNVALLEKIFTAGDTVNPTVLVERGVLQVRKGTTPTVKVLGDGAITKKLVVSGCVVSKSAKEKIEKAGGSIA
jgi:large subunit ribosomal protein L15